MKYKAVIWDLDGTLLNTLEDLMDSVNYGLEKMNLPPITLEQTRQYVGNGVARLVERSVTKGTTKEIFDKVFEYFKEYYANHAEDKTKPYPGMVELMTRLKEEGYKQAIVTNKIHQAVRPLVNTYFPGLIDVALGDRDGIPKKPAPDMVWEAVSELKIANDEAVFIGDSEVDAATGLNSGLDTISVLWGFRDKDVLINAGATVFARDSEELYRLITR